MAQPVVTGLGAVTPVGLTWKDTWEALLAGRSGVRHLTLFDASDFPVRIAAEVPSWDSGILHRKDVRHLDRSTQLALHAAREAFGAANLVSGEVDPKRVGVVVASAVGGITTIHAQIEALHSGGYRRVSPHMLPNMLVDSPAAHIAMELRAQGPNMATVSACATGANAIGEAGSLIARGQADVVVAGGTEACITPLFMAGFCQMRALARGDGSPEAACKPFDRRRDGLVVGEGAGIVILEAADHAASRGAAILAHLAGYGMSCDAYHMASPDPEGAGMAEAMRLALESAGTNPGDVGYINAHGTATHLNDRLEAAAIKQVFGSESVRIPVSSTKAATGHMMGASGAVEAAVVVQVLRDGIAPPTLNLHDPDPACDLAHIPLTPQTVDAGCAMSNSFGMGGHNAALVFRSAALE